MFCSPSSRIWLMLKEGEKGPRVHFLASVAIFSTWLVMSPRGKSASRARAAMDPAEAPDTWRGGGGHIMLRHGFYIIDLIISSLPSL